MFAPVVYEKYLSYFQNFGNIQYLFQKLIFYNYSIRSDNLNYILIFAEYWGMTRKLIDFEYLDIFLSYVERVTLWQKLQMSQPSLNIWQ